MNVDQDTLAALARQNRRLKSQEAAHEQTNALLAVKNATLEAQNKALKAALRALLDDASDKSDAGGAEDPIVIDLEESTAGKKPEVILATVPAIIPAIVQGGSKHGDGNSGSIGAPVNDGIFSEEGSGELVEAIDEPEQDDSETDTENGDEHREPLWDSLDGVYRCVNCSFEVLEGRCQQLRCRMGHLWTPEHSANIGTVGENEALSHDRYIVPLRPPRLLDVAADVPVPPQYANRVDEYRALLARGATAEMCLKYELEYTESSGIVAWADEDLIDTYAGPAITSVNGKWKFHLGNFLRPSAEDSSGASFMADFIEDALVYPVKSRNFTWETVLESPGVWATRRKTPALLDVGSIQPSDVPEHLEGCVDEYRALLARGASHEMCRRYRLEFPHDVVGIVAWADADLRALAGPFLPGRANEDVVEWQWKIHLGHFVRRAVDDVAGAAYMAEVARDVRRDWSAIKMWAWGDWETVREPQSVPPCWVSRRTRIEGPLVPDEDNEFGLVEPGSETLFDEMDDESDADDALHVDGDALLRADEYESDSEEDDELDSDEEEVDDESDIVPAWVLNARAGAQGWDSDASSEDTDWHGALDDDSDEMEADSDAVSSAVATDSTD
ncbi:hypothetical protein PLICRDRAFT_326990 [Plicaturopsis crispa FD-325 SS-3]|nr:hypothetical protein PLICRDRAFT_326990 [Plicaturopsis crispa FD-325 SS-3]